MARPAEFDRNQVLDKAMQAFWDHGYCATSMADLVETTALKPGSIYAAFKSKEGLFLAALDHYGQCSLAAIKQTIEEADTPMAGIRAFFAQLSDSIEPPHAKRSCFLVNTTLEVARDNPAVHERVSHHLNAIEALFRRVLEDAQQRGELPAAKDPRALAAFLMASIAGLRVIAAADSAPERARSVVSQVVALLD